MTNVNDIGPGTPSSSQMAETLGAGLTTLSLDQTVTFTKYVKLILPLDGFVFWVNADLVATSVLANLPSDTCGVNSLTVMGSLHHAVNQRQAEDETIGVNRVLFTTQQEIQDFNAVSPDVIYIATIEDDTDTGVRFAFARRGYFYEAATVWHYEGDAIYPPMESQIIDDLTDFDDTDVVVSNSLPIWLALNSIFQATDPAWNLPMYPSFLVSENILPPYASVHIQPDQTEAIQPVPWLDTDSSHYQLARDMVRITIYGARNKVALDFQDKVFDYSLNTDALGIMSAAAVPITRDEKRTQTELAILAMKKTITFEVSYYQTRANNIARQLILSCIPTFLFGP